MIEREKFIRYKLDEEKEREQYRKLDVRLSRADMKTLEAFKKRIQQPKDSTALKQALDLALAFVRDDRPNSTFRDILLGNRRRNKRIGLVDYD